eukprot:jgi/Ulvmu1/6273/UM028_0133.1
MIQRSRVYLAFLFAMALLATRALAGNTMRGSHVQTRTSSSSNSRTHSSPGGRTRVTTRTRVHASTDPPSQARICESVPFGVEKFRMAQVGFPSNLRQFFPPAYDVPAQATAPIMAGQDPPSVFALADIHGALDRWVQEQIEYQCGGDKNRAGCPYKRWKPWRLVEGSVEACKIHGIDDREEITVKIKAADVLVFGKTIDDIETMGGLVGAPTIFGEQLTPIGDVDPRKWVFGESDFKWTFTKAIDVDIALVNYFLRQREPPPEPDPNEWTPLDLTPYSAAFTVKAKSGDRCLLINVKQSDSQYMGDSEDENSFDTPKIVRC